MEEIGEERRNKKARNPETSFATVCDFVNPPLAVDVFKPSINISTTTKYLTRFSITGAFSIDAYKLSITHGPSGTGKTRGIFEAYKWFNNLAEPPPGFDTRIKFIQFTTNIPVKGDFLFVPITFGRKSPPETTASIFQDLIKNRILFHFWKHKAGKHHDDVSFWNEFLTGEAMNFADMSLDWLLLKLKQIYSKRYVLIVIDEFHKLSQQKYRNDDASINASLRDMLQLHCKHIAFFTIFGIAPLIEDNEQSRLCYTFHRLGTFSFTQRRHLDMVFSENTLNGAENCLAAEFERARIELPKRHVKFQLFLYAITHGHARAIVAVRKALIGLERYPVSLSQLMLLFANEYAEANEVSSNEIGVVSELSLVLALLGPKVTMKTTFRAVDTKSLMENIQSVQHLTSYEGLMLLLHGGVEVPFMSPLQLFALLFPAPPEESTICYDVSHDSVDSSLFEVSSTAGGDRLVEDDEALSSRHSAPSPNYKTFLIYSLDEGLAKDLKELRTTVTTLNPKNFERCCLLSESILRHVRRLIKRYCFSGTATTWALPDYQNMSLAELYGDGDMPIKWIDDRLKTTVKFDFTEPLIVVPIPLNHTGHTHLPTPKECEDNMLTSHVYVMHDQNTGFGAVTFLRSNGGRWIALPDQGKFTYIDADQGATEVLTSWNNTVRVLNQFGWDTSNIVMLFKTNRPKVQFRAQYNKNAIVLCQSALRHYHGLTLSSLIRSATIIKSDEENITI